MNAILDFIKNHGTELVALAGAVVMGARIIVKMTPTPKDDSVLEKIVGFFKHVGLHIDPNEKQ